MSFISDRSTAPRSALINGDPILYVERGRRTPILLVHGSLSDWGVFGKVLGPLGEGHRVVAPAFATTNPER